MKDDTHRRLASLRSALEVVADEDKRRQIKRRIRELEDQIEASAPADRMEAAAMIGAGLALVVWLAASALLGGCGAMPAAVAEAIPDRCACQCGPVEVSVGWADGSGKICAGAGAWRSCWALTGGE